MKEITSPVLSQCLRDFTTLTDSPALARYETQVSRRRWLDELGRLRVWSGNIGAHQVGQSSLDYRLRDASHLQAETIKLLRRMLRVLKDVAEVADEGAEDGVAMELEDEDDSIDGTTEIQQLYQSIVDIVNSLFRISMAIRKPAPLDRLLHTRIKNESFFEPWAQQHVSHKYPSAEAGVVHRLGAAMARQKAVLKYRERHRAKLGNGLFEYIETDSTKLSETVATEVDPDQNYLEFLETASNSGLSQTSYATSLMASQATASIPNPPKQSKDRKPFECPYCFHIIIIKHNKAWARHVFRDLMPYVCLSTHCATPSRLYESRHQWFLHMREQHAKLQNFAQCPLCCTGITPSTSFEKHVGRHLEELALFVLPRTDEGEEMSSEAAISLPSDSAVGEAPRNIKDNTSEPGPTLESSAEASLRIGALEDDSTNSLEGEDNKLEKTDLQVSQTAKDTEPISEESGVIQPQDTPQSAPKGLQELEQDRSEIHFEPNPLAEEEDAFVERLREQNLAWKVIREMYREKFHKDATEARLQMRFLRRRKNRLARRDETDASQGHWSGMDELGKVMQNVVANKDMELASLAQERSNESGTIDQTAIERRLTGADSEYTSATSDINRNQEGPAGPYNAYSYTNPREQFERDSTGPRWYMPPTLSPRIRHRQLRPKTPIPPRPLSRRSSLPEEHVAKSPHLHYTSSLTEKGTKDSNQELPEQPPLAAEGIFGAPREKFPEPNKPAREDIAPRKDGSKKEIPPGAKWTKINRRLVNPAALESAKERFEERADFVIVFRVLTKDEIRTYARKTQEIRDRRHRKRKGELSPM
ncbi:hypothetical protein BJX99DRAFT_233685 [Aspergillus californicus]